MKYKILTNQGYEGWIFWDEKEYEDLTEAVKVAQENSYGAEFRIVNVIAWEAKEL